jgi:hypothetical protein
MVRSSLWSHRPQGKDQLDVRVCHEQDFDQVFGFLGQLWPDVDLEVGVMRGVREDAHRFYEKAGFRKTGYQFCAGLGDVPTTERPAG